MGLVADQLQQKRISHLEARPGENTQGTTVINGEKKGWKIKKRMLTNVIWV